MSDIDKHPMPSKLVFIQQNIQELMNIRMLDSKGCYKWSVFAFKYTWRLGSGESPSLDNSAKVQDISKNQTKASFTISVTFSYINHL